MDALKKAELAKRKVEAGSASPAEISTDDSSLSPTAEKATPGSIDFEPQLIDDEVSDTPAAGPEQPVEPAASPAVAPEDLLALQKIGVPYERRRHKRQFGRPATEAAQAEGVADDATERESIRNLFETKQSPASRKTFAITIGIVTLLAVAGIGWYFWNELQPKSSLQAGAGLNINRPPAAPAATATAAAGEPAIPGLATPSESADNGETKQVREIVGAQPVRPLAVAPTKKLFQLSKAAQPQTDPALERGYGALNRGDTAAAKAAYELALNNDPRNVDALSGLAVLAQRTGNPDQAADYYLRLLEADPHNAFAQAGLIGQRMQMNPAEAEMRLKQALSTQPDSAPLNFSLGNLCAAAKRWPEAQQAYFKAMTADPGNPDYLFNLAVSLDQLRQTRLAASYYAQAIAAAGNRSAGFDQGRASERLRQLQQ